MGIILKAVNKFNSFLYLVIEYQIESDIYYFCIFLDSVDESHYFNSVLVIRTEPLNQSTRFSVHVPDLNISIPSI